MKKILVYLGVLSVCVMGVVAVSGNALAGECAGVNTSIINCGEEDGVNFLLHTVINIMMSLVGILAVAGVAFSGYQYMTAAGDPGKMAKAKNRIVQIVLGLIVFAVMWAVAEWLIPGGVLS